MILKIKNEQVWQLLSDSMTIGPSPTGYDLQVGADSKNFTTLFSVGANTPRMVTNVANGSYFRMKNNVGDVEVNWQRTCAGGGGGTGGNAGELEPVTNFPVGAPAGTVVALSSGGTVGVYQYDGTDWAPIGGGDMSNYYTKAETDAAITGATQGFATEAYVTAATAPIQTQLDDVERVTATALTELHQDILDLSGSTSEFVTSGDVATQITAATANLMTSSATQTMINAATSGITEELSDLEDMMETKEEVIAAALVDLNDNKVGSTTVSTIVALTQAEYDALTVKDPNTFYIITNN